jgi:hypothetical protein
MTDAEFLTFYESNNFDNSVFGGFRVTGFGLLNPEPLNL